METPAKEKRAGVRSVYMVEDLSEEAMKKAHGWYVENAGDTLHQSHMINLLTEELDERGIKYGYAIGEQDPDVRYSLSHCQGDGFMFVGGFEFKGETVRVSHHDPHYYHKYTAQMDWPNFVGEEREQEEEKLASEFVEVYRAICDEMEQKGYDEIEYELSKDVFMEAAAANEWTFTDTGERLDADSTV